MILTDTGFWVALINSNDKHHDIARNFISHSTESLITTWPILTETCHLLGRSFGVRTQLKFLELIRSSRVKVFVINDKHIDRMMVLIEKYVNLPMDLADASLVILAEELGHGRILSTDQRDFNAYRWKNYKPFENLLLAE